MPAPIDSFPVLRRYRIELPADATIYEQGTTPAFFYLLLTGRVVFEVLDGTGTPAIVAEVHPGETLGVVSAFSGRPTSAAARAAARSVLIAVPMSAATDVFKLAPEFALMIIRQLTQQQPRSSRPAAADLDDVVPVPEPASSAQAASADGAGPSGLPAPGAARPAEVASPAAEAVGAFNEQWFFRDEAECPVCNKSFEYLRVRASAVRPTSRDSDFRIVYSTVDPSLYAVMVCPHCGYASYVEDFADISAMERRALLAARGARMPVLGQARRDLGGERDVEDAMVCLDLALACAKTRGAGLRRVAGLLHRRAWIERSRGDEAAELVLIEQTRDAYREVFEQDPDIQDNAAMRVAYLIGDLTLRLGDTSSARRWLHECTRMPGANGQEGLLRMARLRLDEAKEPATEGLARTA